MKTKAISDEEYIKRVMDRTTAGFQFLTNNRFVKDWFGYTRIDPIDNIRIAYNMSNNPALARWFCSFSQSTARTFVSFDVALNYIKCNNKVARLLIKFVELETYGAYTPEELSTFINNMKNQAANSHENKSIFGDLKCNLSQFVFDDQRQKIVFKYKDKTTLQELSEEIKLNTGYDIQVIEAVNGDSEVIVQKEYENKADADKGYVNMKSFISREIAAEMERIIPMEELPNCCNPKFMYLDTTPTKDFTPNDITRRGVVPVNITINITTNNIAGGNNTINIGNTTTISAADQRAIKAVEWIRSNPPNHLEKKSDYHSRYIAANPNGCVDGIFGKIMKNSEKYKSTRIKNVDRWNSKLI
jgi:hypothetical protein